MKKFVKTLCFPVLFFFFTTTLSAQLKAPDDSAFTRDFKKIIENYPDHFNNLKGELLEENVQSVEYSCNCTISGAEESTITLYSSKKNNVYSWQAVMLTSDDFEKAAQKFSSLFKELKSLAVSTGGASNYHLRGMYESPAVEKKFTSVLFSFDPPDEHIKKLKAELSIEFYPPMEWKVKVLLYNREREDIEQGKTVEN